MLLTPSQPVRLSQGEKGRRRDDGLRPVMSLMTGVLRRKSAEECPGPQEQLGGGCLTSVRAC